MSARKIYIVQPRGILIAGKLTQFDGDEEKIESFELYKQNQTDIRLLTFDEVYKRAQYLLGIEMNNKYK
jgi:antiviral defense system Shedu protein SduA